MAEPDVCCWNCQFLGPYDGRCEKQMDDPEPVRHPRVHSCELFAKAPDLWVEHAARTEAPNA